MSRNASSASTFSETQRRFDQRMVSLTARLQRKLKWHTNREKGVQRAFSLTTNQSLPLFFYHHTSSAAHSAADMQFAAMTTAGASEPREVCRPSTQQQAPSFMHPFSFALAAQLRLLSLIALALIALALDLCLWHHITQYIYTDYYPALDRTQTVWLVLIIHSLLLFTHTILLTSSPCLSLTRRLACIVSAGSDNV